MLQKASMYVYIEYNISVKIRAGTLCTSDAKCAELSTIMFLHCFKNNNILFIIQAKFHEFPLKRMLGVSIEKFNATIWGSTFWHQQILAKCTSKRSALSTTRPSATVLQAKPLHFHILVY